MRQGTTLLPEKSPTARFFTKYLQVFVPQHLAATRARSKSTADCPDRANADSLLSLGELRPDVSATRKLHAARLHDQDENDAADHRNDDRPDAADAI